jgi:hypothetical protein
MPAILQSQQRLPAGPSHPLLVPITARDVHKQLADSLSRHLRSPPVPSRPVRLSVGWSESGAKSFGRRSRTALAVGAVWRDLSRSGGHGT